MTDRIYIFLVLLAFRQTGTACSCIGTSTVKDEIKRSDLVIVGQVISKNIVSTSEGPPGFLTRKAHYKVLISNAFKGRVTMDTLTIITGLGGGDCGFDFQIGQQYIIYGRKDLNVGYGETRQSPNTFETDICTRTRPRDDKELIEIRKVRAGKKWKSNSH